MNLIYKGKTKDVYDHGDGTVLLKFKDDMTGKDGVFDPGENQVGLTVAGMGRQNLLLTDFFYKLLEKHGIRTHFISSDIDRAEMVVRACRPFGYGLEVIYRNYAVGSFLRRYGLYATEMMPLPDYVEFTIKDDKRQDPLITQDALIVLGILTADEYLILVDQTRKIARLLTSFMKEKGLDLIDIKFEFGKTRDGEIVLMDEISSGSMRVYQNGKKLEPEQVSKIILAA